MRRTLLALTLLAWAVPAFAQDDPITIVRPGKTVTVYSDRVEILYDGFPAPIRINVGKPAPAPKPDPNPTPVPPTPPPGPPVPTGPLWAALVLPDPPTPALTAVRTDASLRQAFADRGAVFRSYLATEAEVQGPTWQAAVASAGGPPAVVWMGDRGKVYGVTKGADAASIRAELVRLRGK